MVIKSAKRKCTGDSASYAEPKKIRWESHQELNEHLDKGTLNCESVIPNNNYERHYPSKFITFIYKLYLSMWWLLKKHHNKQKVSPLAISFEDSEIDLFKDIVIRYKSKSVHVKIIDDHFIDYTIGYSRLFSKSQIFSLNQYFNSYAKNRICKSFRFLKHVEYLIIYTNLSLDLDKDQMMSEPSKPKLCPLKFERMNIDKHEILQKFLFSQNSLGELNFYQFSQDGRTKTELLERLELTSSLQKAAKDRKMSNAFLDNIKRDFLNKLVFAVDQPCSEELRKLIRAKVHGSRHSLSKLQEEAIQSNLTGPPLLYEIKFLISVASDVMMHNRLSLSYENDDASNFIIINYKNKLTFVNVCLENQRLSLKHLLPLKNQKEKNKMSLSHQFIHFIREYKKNQSIKFFVIYTNAKLDLCNINNLRLSNSKESFSFEKISIDSKRFKVLRYLSGVDAKYLYQFNLSETNNPHLFESLCYPKQKDEIITDECIMQLKKLFLHKLIIATNQPNDESLEQIIKAKISELNMTGIDGILEEIVLRWTESIQFGWMTQSVARQILDDVKNHRSTYQKLQRKDISAEIKFTKSVIDREGSTTFNHFLHYVVSGKGRKILQNFKKCDLKLTTLSGILHKTGTGAVKALENLHETCFDENGRESFYLQTLKRNGIKLSTMCRFLLRAGHFASNSFEKLFYTWFDVDGNKRRYLRILEKQKISLTHMSSILHGGGSDVAQSFTKLFDLLFDEHGNKTKYLILPEKHGLVLANFTSILHFSGPKAADAFKNMYDILFDESGKESFYLRTLKENSIELTIFCPLLHGSGSQAATLFENVFHLLFDDKGNKTQYLTTLQREGISLVHLTKMLGGARSHILKTFKELYDLWFDSQGNKTQYLIALEKNNIDLQSMTTILYGTGIHVVQAFKNLYHLWFDENGGKTLYLQTLQKNGIHLRTIGYMLYNTRKNASDTYKTMHHIVFNDQGDKSERLLRFEKEGITFASLCGVLKTSSYQAKIAFDDLYSLWFNDQGDKTRYLNNFERNGLRPSMILIVIRASGASAAKAYKSLHDCWFEQNDEKTSYLKNFEENGSSLLMIARMLQNGGRHSAQVFKDIHDLFFDEKGQKTICIKTLEKEGVDILRIVKVMRKTGFAAIPCFRNFYEFFFDADGNQTHFYRIFKANQVSLPCILDIFSRLRAKSYQVIEALYYIFFTREGEKTHFTSILETNKICINQILNIVWRANDKAAQILINLYEVWFDESGNESQRLIDLQRKNLSFADVVKRLERSGPKVVDKFMKL
ncbi:hypothetical protein QAD02_015702 [Eretmocerus hayati]|uniref:Uncharacterized protein n=1 Tax=Eretmocerus hayati TaxID=131215 RepID=A0ACC2P8J6_9HYME|nr:hypothetical protein QAD02_015702 [Eretmocerus hayati]